MSIHEDIYKWASKLPAWQQHLLGRIVENSTLREADIAEAVTLCKAEAGIPKPKDSAASAKPLEAPSLASSPSDTRPVRLHGIKDVININALAADQQITFADDGITVVYGDNGSGKTGFGRLLRTLCWAREKPDKIHGNLASPPGLTQQARVTFAVGPATQEALWEAGKPAPPELSRMSVFDSNCASVYISQNQEVAFMPYGLDLFARLAAALDVLAETIQKDIGVNGISKITLPAEYQGTELAVLLSKLADAKIIDALRALSVLSPDEAEEKQKLEALRVELKGNDPLAKAHIARTSAKGLRQLALRLRGVHEGLSIAQAAKVSEALADVGVKDAAAKAASALLSGKDLLPGTGDAVWRTLWDSAKEFGKVALPSTGFLPAQEGTPCVLCQQPLGTEAVQRFTSFEEFVTNKSSTELRESQEILDRLKGEVQRIATNWPDLDDRVGEVGGIIATAGVSLRASLDAAKSRQAFLGGTVLGADMAQCPVLVGEELPSQWESAAVNLEATAKGLEDSVNVEARAKQEARWAELERRAWIGDHWSEIEQEVERLVLLTNLAKAKDSASTTPISKQGAALTKKHVTEELARRFREELQGLRGGGLGVDLEKTVSKKGVTSHRLVLRSTTSVPIAEILSTGEQNVVAIAAFLAELISDTHHGVIFDDPVSSLDQDRRDWVAARLVTLGKVRQVIIWTHDLTFVGALVEASRRAEVADPSICTLANVNGVAGFVEQEAPWPLLKVNDRVKALRRDLDAMREKSGASSAGSYADATRRFYERLRETWERTVEEVLLNDVVVRWRRGVETQRLKKIADHVTSEDFQAISNHMSHCSAYCHDQQGATPPPTPRIDEMDKDLSSLKEWVDQKRKSQDK